MIKKLTVEIDGTEIELTPEQAKQLRDELLRLYPVDSAPAQPLMPPPMHLIPRIGDDPTPVDDDPLWPYSSWPRMPRNRYPVSPFRWESEITCGQPACNFRDTSVWQ